MRRICDGNSVSGRSNVPKQSANPIDKYVGRRVRMRRMMLDMSQQKLGEGGLPRSSIEAGVMLVERREWVIAVELGPTGVAGSSPKVQRKAPAFARWHQQDDARVSIPESVRGSG